MAFFVLAVTGIKNKIVDKLHFLNTPGFLEQYQVIDSDGVLPDGRPLAVHVPFGDGLSDTEVKVSNDGAFITIVSKIAGKLYATVVNVGQNKQLIKVNTMIVDRPVCNDYFQSVLISLMCEEHSHIKNRRRRMVMKALICATKARHQECLISFTDKLGRLVKVLLNYRSSMLKVMINKDVKFIAFDNLHHSII